jgi:hypothetical protein
VDCITTTSESKFLVHTTTRDDTLSLKKVVIVSG